MGAFEDGTSFLAGVFAKIPEGIRAQVKEALEKPEAKDAVTLIGESVLARSDYSRNMDGLKTKETELQQKLDNLNTWYAENKAALEEYVAIKPEYEELKTKTGTPPVVKKEEPPQSPTDPRKIVEDVLGEQGPQFVQVAAWLAGQVGRHQQMFGEPFDPMEIVSNPKLGKPIAGQPGRLFSLQDAYNEKFGERVAAKQKEVEEKKFEAEVEKRIAERNKQTGQPFPLRSESPSVLDVLTTKEGPAAHTLDSAVAEYDRLQQVRTAT